MDKMQEYIEDCIINYLTADDEWETNPVVSVFELKGIWVVAFTVNKHPLIYDIDEILWYGLDNIAKRDNWRQW